LIDQGYLSKFRAFAPSHPDLSGVKTVAGDYHQEQLSGAMSKPELVADVVETWIRQGEGRPTLCFGVDRAHAKHLQQRFLDAGITCGYQDAYTDAYERKAIKDAFHQGDYAVVCNVGTLTTGVDWDVRCIILARPTKSEILYVQIIGRGLRTAEGKEDCLILDHSDTSSRLGLVTDIHHDRLDDGKPNTAEAKKPPLPKECPKCHFLRPPRVSVCPACGFKPEVKSNVEVVDGELIELTKTQKKRHNAGVIELQGRPIPLADFYGELKSYGRLKGYKPGWASNKYRDAVGVWPNAHKYAPDMPVSFEVDSWIRASIIRFAKKQGKVAA
jgi:superfamily II DNA or RNA helicase